ncbi:MAG: hypothetical protein AVDCRST_MAG08-2824 [uncultured Acetobacteraceae bacterium]|uniref:Uncharacterized protein n=1 Tax=uncultured Acetobacteraceae bacterium TaxID=169975 RepID=A0A6J4IWJ5_9PROT|nr:MAG: hypothetical protein AVDCRST_MAG08-2824 [uncultured Acetobacteraceae bacterium]
MGCKARPFRSGRHLLWMLPAMPDAAWKVRFRRVGQTCARRHRSTVRGLFR